MTLQKELKIIRKYLRGMTGVPIMRQFHISQDTFYKILKKHSIPRKTRSEQIRKYSVDEHFFQTIDSPEKAYLLGWAFSDGCNNKKMNGFRINLHEQDLEIIKKFKKYTKSEHPIKYIKKQKQYSIFISSKIMSEDLQKLGCIPVKSLVLKWPRNLSEEYIKLFIRGYFEGDGCISTYQNKNCKTFIGYKLDILGSHQFISKLSKIINKILKIRFSYSKKKSISVLYSGDYYKILNLLEWLYEDHASLRLSRKYKRFKIMKEKKGTLFKKYK